jgi:hypothetical protein
VVALMGAAGVGKSRLVYEFVLFLGAAYVLAGRVAEALPLLERVVQQTDAMGDVFDHVLGVIPLGEGYLRAARLEDAQHQARHAVEVCRHRPLPRHGDDLLAAPGRSQAAQVEGQ